LTLRDAIATASGKLTKAGIEGASGEAWLLLSHVTGRDRATLFAYAEDQLSAADERALMDLVERRAQHEPVALIVGQKEFWSLPFTITSDVLCPRPDSETLVEMALTLLWQRDGEQQPPCLLDFGTGSGCVILALLSELPKASAIGVDQSLKSLAIAKANGERLGLSSRVNWICADWGTALSGNFDLIVSNPPYIKTGDWPTLSPEIRLFEPDAALLAGEDGLDAYRKLAPDIARLLSPDGIAVVEHGIHQGDAIADIMSKAGLNVIDRKADLAGIDRCLAVMRTAQTLTP